MNISVEEVKKTVSQLPLDQLKSFRIWYKEFDSEIWDEQIKEDVFRGKLDSLANQAIADHKAGKTRKL